MTLTQAIFLGRCATCALTSWAGAQSLDECSNHQSVSPIGVTVAGPNALSHARRLKPQFSATTRQVVRTLPV
jgi:hypothetical protein